MKKQKKDPLYKSFGYAFAGIFAVVSKERNMKIHCVAMVCVVIAGLVFRITPVEWCICLTLFGLVMALETVNTAVEAVVDLVTEERKPLAKLAKELGLDAIHDTVHEMARDEARHGKAFEGLLNRYFGK